MLATAGQPPTPDGWATEFKWDGARAIIAAAGDRVRITSRNRNDVTAGYPEIVAAGLGTDRSVLLDGELITLNAQGKPDFGMLQERMHVRGPVPGLQARVPVTACLFDLLELDGCSLINETYDVRRALLLDLRLDELPRISVPAATTGVSPTQMLEIAKSMGLEGVVAKRRNSRYEPGRRSRAWIKTALVQTQEVIIGGWTTGEGRRAHSLGALLLGAYDDNNQLRYLGHVGTGVTEAMLRDLLATLETIPAETSPFGEPVPREHERKAHWVRPLLVGEVVYRTFTADGRLRHAAWRGIRPDQDPGEVVLADAHPAAEQNDGPLTRPLQHDN
jgi:bifunctional non-homologous end joining protein LigD